jgi:hypothetical protein
MSLRRCCAAARRGMRIPERWRFQRAGEVEEFRDWLADEKAELPRGEDRRCTALGWDGWTSQGRSPRKAVLPGEP